MAKNDTDTTQVDFSKSAEDFFLRPGIDAGLASCETITHHWRPTDRAKICGFAVSKFDDHNRRVNDIIDGYTDRRAFTSAIEFNTVPVVADQLKVVKNLMLVSGRGFMSGAGGSRLRNQFIWNHGPNGYENEAEMVASFEAAQSAKTNSGLPDFDGDISQLPFVIEARNLKNYFHFLTETLPRLEIAEDIDHRGPIVITYPEQAVGGFVMAFITALYPDIADQVILQPAPYAVDRALTTFTFDHYYFQASPSLMPSVDDHAPRSWVWQGRRATRGTFLTLELNRIHDIQRRLRRRALAAVAGMETDHLPRRFWVERSGDTARDRALKNEKKLVEQLRLIGFEVIRFEDYSPLEQIALMANCEVMASHHGAGYANMMFAAHDAHVIEISTPQVAAARWSDFIPLAHVAGCHYVSFFADHDWATPEKEPKYDSDGLVPVAVHDASIKTIARYVRGLTGDFPTNANKNEVILTARHLRRSKSFKALRRYLDAFPKYVQAEGTLLQIIHSNV